MNRVGVPGPGPTVSGSNVVGLGSGWRVLAAILLMIQILSITLRTLNYGSYGIFLITIIINNITIMGNAGFMLP